MHCQIVGLSQDMDFDENVAQTFVVLLLPDGSRVKAAIDDNTAAKVITLRVQEHGSAPQPKLRAPVEERAPVIETSDVPMDDESGPVVFGGDAEGLDEDLPDEAASGAPFEPEESFEDDYDIPPAPPEVAAAHEAVLQEAHLGTDGKPLSRARRGKAPNEKKVARTQQHGQAKPAARKNLFKTATGALVAPAKTVPMNSAGFPIAPNGVDPDSITGSGAGDEDGVTSV